MTTRHRLALCAAAALMLSGCQKEKPEPGPSKAYIDSVLAVYAGHPDTMTSMSKTWRDSAECCDTPPVAHMLPGELSPGLTGISKHWRTVATGNREQHVITIEFLCPGPAPRSHADENARWICRDMAAAAPQDRFHWDAVRCDYDGIATYEMAAPLPEKSK